MKVNKPYIDPNGFEHIFSWQVFPALSKKWAKQLASWFFMVKSSIFVQAQPNANPVSVASQENQHLRTSLQLHAMSSVSNNASIFIDVSGSKPHR